MGEPRVVFDHVWKQFARGERHDSLRDLIPSFIRRVTGRRQAGGVQEGSGPDVFWALQDVTFEVRANEIYFFSQIRMVRSVHRAEGWTPESIAEHAMPSLEYSFYPNVASLKLTPWDPL